MYHEILYMALNELCTSADQLKEIFVSAIIVISRCNKPEHESSRGAVCPTLYVLFTSQVYLNKLERISKTPDGTTLYT